MKKNKKVLALLMLIGVILFGYLIFRVRNDFFKKQDKTVVDSIGLYGYTLEKTDTKLYENYFKELSKILNEKTIDYEKYAEYLSKLFIVDTFTLNNKLASTDIGGTEFIHPDLKENFKENMGNNMYRNIEVNLDGKRQQELPIVKDVTIDTIKEDKAKYNGKEYDGYIIKANIEYEKDLGYQTEIELTLIKDDKILYIIKGN